MYVLDRDRIEPYPVRQKQNLCSKMLHFRFNMVHWTISGNVQFLTIKKLRRHLKQFDCLCWTGQGKSTGFTKRQLTADPDEAISSPVKARWQRKPGYEGSRPLWLFGTRIWFHSCPVLFFLVLYKTQRRKMTETGRMGQGHFGCAGQGDASTGVFGLMSRYPLSMFWIFLTRFVWKCTFFTMLQTFKINSWTFPSVSV